MKKSHVPVVLFICLCMLSQIAIGQKVPITTSSATAGMGPPAAPKRRLIDRIKLHMTNTLFISASRGLPFITSTKLSP